MPAPTPKSALLVAIEGAFSAAYLFDAVNYSWRGLVVDTDEDAGGEFQPLDVDAQLLFSFPGVVGACSGSQAAMVAQVADAVKASTVVNVHAAAADVVVLRRAAALAKNDDPALRTVFARPVHYDATPEQVAAFFAEFGAVERVDRRHFIQSGSERARPSTFVVFATIAGAQACCKGKPSYGGGSTELGGMFVPKLQVMMKADHEHDASVAIANDAAKNAREVVNAAAAGGADDDETSRFLRPGHTVKMANIPAGSKWADVKAKLGNLGMNQPSLKKKVGVVQIVGSTGYAFCKTAEVAKMLLLTYTAVLAGEDKSLPEKFVADFRAAVPSMTLLDGAEEQEVIKLYPEWAGGKVKRKQILNSKRGRE
jgi:hypothetical protein